MKKSIALILILVVTLFTAVAADGNVDGGGGGGMGGGSGGSSWSPGNDGVRVTLVDAQTGYRKSKSIDMSNKALSIPESTIYFGYEYKTHYSRINQIAHPKSYYNALLPYLPIPTIISSASGGKADIEQIRKYFCSEDILKFIAHYVGIDYETMIAGDYKLLIEPVAYFKFNGTMFAMTATEAACYDAQIGGKLRSKMVSLTHKNLPMSMFLQTADLGYPAWAGSTSTPQSDATIISNLGLGIIYFKEQEPTEPGIGTGDFVYHTDTDVITPLYIYSPTTYMPDKAGTVTFTVGGKKLQQRFICPKGGTQMVWFKWHTPSTPQTMTITVGGVTNGTLTAQIVALEEKEPPDPKFADSNKNFTLKSTPQNENKLSAEWYEWVGMWSTVGKGHWVLMYQEYQANMKIDYNLTPDTRVPTAYNRSFGEWEMKSNYGVQTNVKVSVSGQGGVTADDITPAQHVEAVFSDFDYQTYNRFLVPDEKNKYTTSWRFKPNRYSYYNDAVHFVPLWYPDNTDYVVPVTVMDVWTPGGQLQATISDKVAIQGTSYDDWYIRNY